MRHINYIEDEQHLIDVCQQYQQAKILAVDTEFVRTRTLYAQLGLVQLYDGQVLSLIDPVKIKNLTPFWQLMADANIEKVLHACSEDLEVFLTAGNCRPVNVIDSQIMMAFLGHGLSIGYAVMVAKYAGIEVDKSESRTNWLKRPLTEKQCQYAAADVQHLFDIYPQLLNDVKAAGWLDAVKQETALMIARKFTPIDETQLYKSFKLAWRLSPEQLYRLQQLAIWRYQKAQLKDKPLGFIVKEHTLLSLAQVNPKNVGVMGNIEGIELLDIRYQGKAMLSVLRRCEKAESREYPKKIERLDDLPGYKQYFKKVKNFVVNTAEIIDLPAECLASKKQINQFLSWYYQLNNEHTVSAIVDIMYGWRKEILGDKLVIFIKNDYS